ncbi:MAG TPA: universal stress protein [Gemmatimonadaceae bacterium]|jgi:nucleotide-binding universal stress UspA family protein|nr:universal stress protein [Gemmatimonadaceae bacterium]
MFRKLLVPLDRSSLAEEAIGHAASIARQSRATIDLVLVHEPLAFGGFADLPWEADSTGEQKYLESIAGELESGASVRVTCAVVRGAPGDMIGQRARDTGADLIVMTSHGRTGFSRTWLGSVADAVMRKSAIPVLILRPEYATTTRRTAVQSVQRILVPLDGSPLAIGVLPAAMNLARATHASIVLLRVVPVVPVMTAYEPTVPVTSMPIVPDAAATQQLADEATTELESVSRRLHEETGVAVESQVVIAEQIAQSIVDQIGAKDVDVVAMSTHGRGASRWLFGSVADKVLRSSRVPVLLYRPVDARGGAAVVAEPEISSQSPTVRLD